MLGTNIRFLIDAAEEGTRIHGEGFILENLDRTRTLLEELGLTVSRRLVSFTGLDRLREELAASDADANLNAEQAASLEEKAQQLRETTLAESLGVFAYVTRDKRLDVDKLLDEPSKLFPRGVYASLSDMSQLDVAEGFKCIGFERPTAAAFHLMRAVEDSLRCFYLATVKRGRVSPLLWKAMTDQLQKRRQPPSASLLAQLDHIRGGFRNPTQHPDAVYDVDEAQDLAFLSIDVLTRLVRAMP